MTALRPMTEQDLDTVMEIELRGYPFPWTKGIFRDCLHAHYPSWILHEEGKMIGYAVLSVVVDEAHILNICIDPKFHGRGHGRRLLQAMHAIAKSHGAQRLFLEVRPSNVYAIKLYESAGFNEIGRRPRYYPAEHGREDAIVMAMELFTDDTVTTMQ